MFYYLKIIIYLSKNILFRSIYILQVPRDAETFKKWVMLSCMNLIYSTAVFSDETQKISLKLSRAAIGSKPAPKVQVNFTLLNFELRKVFYFPLRMKKYDLSMTYTMFLTVNKKK